jgi:hypothetical protein
MLYFIFGLFIVVFILFLILFNLFNNQQEDIKELRERNRLLDFHVRLLLFDKSNAADKSAKRFFPRIDTRPNGEPSVDELKKKYWGSTPVEF